MKKVILYAAILAALFTAPAERLDVGKLRPVQVVLVYQQSDQVVIETDTGDAGIGATALQALENMEDTTAGVIYLDTAEYLLLSKDAEDAAEELRQALHGSTQLCYAAHKIDMAEAGKFLAAHGKLPELKDWEKGQELPILAMEGERLTFLKKVENNA